MADRGFGSSLETALSGESAALAFMLYLDWPDGEIRLGSWVGTKAYGGHDWLGAGDLISIDKIVDTVDKSDVGIEVTVNYLNDDLRNELTTTATEDIVGSEASIYLALLDAAAGTITEAYEVFPGKLDEVSILDSGTTGAITLRIACELADLGKRHFLRLTDAHQQYLFPGDKGLEYSAHMDEPILWGRKPVSPLVYGGPAPSLSSVFPGFADYVTDPNNFPPGFNGYTPGMGP